MATVYTAHFLVSIVALLLICLLGNGVRLVTGVGCFVCSSINGSDPDCEDTFNNTGNYYQQTCMAVRKGRSGLFPATDCIKLKAKKGSYTVTVRDCTVDNGDLTPDTEMGRNSQCSIINIVEYDNVLMNGCSASCSSDGCNLAGHVTFSKSLVFVSVSAVVTLTQTFT